MSGHRYTPAEYTLHRIVKSSGNLLFQFEEAHSTHTYWVISHFCQLEKINYLVLRYLNTCVCHLRSFPRILCSTTKADLCLFGGWPLETFRTGSSCKGRARGRVSGRNKETKRKLDKCLYLVNKCCIDFWD